jgi:hypothetical protein
MSVFAVTSRIQADVNHVQIDPAKVLIFLLALVPFVLCWTTAVVVKVVLAASREGWRAGGATLIAKRPTGGG